METKLQTRPENSSSPSGERDTGLLVMGWVRRAAFPSLTREVEAILKCQPMRVFSLRDVSSSIGPHVNMAEVNSVLHKMVYMHGKATLSREHNGRRVVNMYQWRLPSHAR